MHGSFGKKQLFLFFRCLFFCRRFPTTENQHTWNTSVELAHNTTVLLAARLARGQLVVLVKNASPHPKIKYNEASQIATGPHFVLSKNNAPNTFKSTGFSVSYISETYYMNEKPQYVSSNHEDVLLPIFFFMGKDGNL